MAEYMDKCRLCLGDLIGGVTIFARLREENYASLIFSLFQFKVPSVNLQSPFPSLTL